MSRAEHAIVLALFVPLAEIAQSPSEPVAEIVNIRFHSDELMNLHHTLYAAAWSGRNQRQPSAQALPASLTAPFTDQERRVWEESIRYYDQNIASRDLLFGEGMVALKTALVAGELNSPAIPAPLKSTLEAARPVFRKYFWPEQDRVNRRWISSTVRNMGSVAAAVIPKLEKAYETKWFTTPVRADIVWVGNWAGGYTTDDPAHATMSSTHPSNKDWPAVETVFHEYSHELVLGLEKKLAAALGNALKEHDTLWHTIQFYITGIALQETLKEQKVEFTPFIYTARNMWAGPSRWSRYQKPVQEIWGPYLHGQGDLDEAIAKTATAVR